MILLDTCVLTLALRRRRKDLSIPERRIVMEVGDRISDGTAAIIGPVRQEVLSGISAREWLDRLCVQLEPVADLPLGRESWVKAAEFANACKSAGHAPSAGDMIICAAAHVHDALIFTTDKGFDRYARVLPIELYNF